MPSSAAAILANSPGGSRLKANSAPPGVDELDHYAVYMPGSWIRLYSADRPSYSLAPPDTTTRETVSSPLKRGYERPPIQPLAQGRYWSESMLLNYERREFGLRGLLPSNIQTLDQQVKRAYQQYQSKQTDINKNTFMTSLKMQNEPLYYKTLLMHLKEMLPVIYTPTEGTAIENYSRVFRRPEGIFLTINQPEEIEASLGQAASPEDIDIVAVSDGEQILGIGDQGVGGILISIAKLVLYTTCAGIHPSRTLPVVLDCGTNNQNLLNDDFYLGYKHPRVRGEQYDAFVDNFVQAARKRFPNAFIHFEDFGVHNARRILDRYMSSIPCFNDDVQGTGCVTLAAITAAARASKVNVGDLRCLMYGAGTAGVGIADQISDAIALNSGKSKEDAKKQIYCIDKDGLILQSMEGSLNPAQKGYARPDKEWQDTNTKSLLDVVKQVKPHVLIGTSTQPKAFTKEVVQEMSKHVDRPIIFPLSNPTRLHEATPKDLFEWTDGRVLTATGSPFDPVETKDGKQLLSRAKLITTAMLVEATKALADQAPALKDPDAALLPDVEDVREVSLKVAAAVIKQAVKEGLAQEKDIPNEKEDLEEWIRVQMWKAEYRPLKKVA
ncbi:NAD-dependent malic enzyme mitochondrial [Penicillium chermesinum]|nr:NAD-dependent malic enzyme mitochondrial [Penicillium chermesinum]